ncbi:hypothetical protein [Virgisporangium aurantiacum]|uniref:Uncharacterized protein n=1 Tax=Virgisporangium aurantiacum TaxID=175570 RepID=A0A8J4E4B3_9ACTN|nr:hypothetical protein [Virgisporangium aurantiacum]GIJ60894.1 hypothetical protein Vau01_084100 [Virgisporangium aurantiacum]
MTEHGVALVELVIGSVRADPGRLLHPYNTWDGPWVAGEPSPVTPPDAFPSGRPLSPALRRWLEFDAGLLRRFGWFDDGGRLTPRPLAEIAADAFGPIGKTYDSPALAERFAECFLLPGGSDSRRVLATGPADALGEYPVFALDVDDLPCVELMYPGLDVYLAETAGVIEVDRAGKSYSALKEDARYAQRMREHARGFLNGEYHEDFTAW